MEPFAVAYIERLRESVKGFNAALEGLPSEALDWSPGAQLNSIAVLATHAAAAVRYLVGDVIARDSSHRVREKEFQTKGVDGAALSKRFADVTAYTERVVAGLTTEQLGEERFSPQHNSNYTVAWCLYRSLDHLSEHMGHAQVTRLLWEQRGKSE